MGMPSCRSMRHGLRGNRTDLPTNRIARVLVCLRHGKLVALHSFIKRTQKTPDLEQAARRLIGCSTQAATGHF
ncbi:MAG: type II toxin-antitoxin system RelE/ParE family toxin [Sulfuriferula sp.]